MFIILSWLEIYLICYLGPVEGLEVVDPEFYDDKILTFITSDDNWKFGYFTGYWDRFDSGCYYCKWF